MAPLKAEKESSPLQTEGTQPPEDAGQGPKQRPSLGNKHQGLPTTNCLANVKVNYAADNMLGNGNTTVPRQKTVLF